MLIGSAGCINPFQMPPAAVTQAAYEACNAGRYSQAEELFSTAARQTMALGGGIKMVCDLSTRNGAIQNFKIDNVDVRGQGATVKFTIRFKGGDTKSDSDDLILEKGAWKITR
jgi:hypothetical protein